jgi:hypothetical protein
MTVTPSLGQFSAGTAYTVKKLDETLISSGVIGASGSVTLSLNGYTGPVVVTILGGTGVTYWDEGTNSDVLFPAPNTLRAVVPTPMTTVGVTALTNAAAAKLDNAPGGMASATTGTISTANTKVAAMFGLADILTAPTPVNNTTAASLDLATPGDKYALVLAAFAKSATGGNAMTLATSLAADLTDDKLDGLVALGVTPISGTPVSSAAVAAAYQTMATTLATPTSALVVANQPLVVTPDVTAVAAVNNQSDVALAKAMFAELRTTLQSFSNGSKTGFLDTQAQRASDDLNANVGPNMDRVASRLNGLGNAKKMFEDAVSNPGGLTVMSTPAVTNGTATAAAGTALTRQMGTWEAVWAGTGGFEYCWTGSASGLGGKVTCAGASNQSADYANNRIKLIVYELTAGSSTNQYNYIATRYNVPVTVSGGVVTPGALSVANSVPAGSGTYTATGTAFSLNGTMPPSHTDVLGNLDTGVDTIALAGTRTTLSTNNYRYAFSGSVATVKTADSTKVVTLSVDAGTFLDLDESNLTTTGKRITSAKLIGTLATTATKFTGTFDLTNWSSNVNATDWRPNSVVFNGSISDTSTGGAGQLLTGKIEVAVTNAGSYNPSLPESTSNYSAGTFTFTGTVQAPSRPLLKLVVGGVRTGFNTKTATVNYSYGTKSITGSGSSDGANPANDSMLLTNQDGIQMVTKTGIVSKSGTQVATLLNNMVSYVDGVTESLQ